MVKKIMAMTGIFTLIAGLFGCSLKPQVADGPGMEYVDSDYRTEYANELDFDSLEGKPYFAVAFLGYGEEGKENRDSYVKEIFENLSEESVEKVAHFDYEGDEWYLVIPRYREYVTITYLETDETDAVYTGEAFTIKCNLSDLHSNVEISIDSHSGQKFSPQLDGTGKLAASQVVWDITDYSD